MNIANPVGSEITSVAFSVYRPDEVRRTSVRRIVNPQLLDNLGHPAKGGLYDPALGPYSKHHLCGTCSLDHFSCPGHFGHIDLPLPVFHPLWLPRMFSLLRSACMNCHRFRMSRVEVGKAVAKLRLLDAGAVVEAGDLDAMLPKVKAKRAAAPSPAAGEEEALDPGRDEEGGGDDEEEESEDAYLRRVDDFVEKCLAGARARGRACRRRITVEEDELRRAVNDFTRRLQAKNKCENCGAHSPKYRKDGYVKIFQKPLPKKLAAQNEARKFGVKKHEEILARMRRDKPARRADSDRSDMDDDGEELPEEDGDEEVEVGAPGEDPPSEKQTLMTPMHVKGILQLLWEKEGKALDQLFGRFLPSGKRSASSAEMFFVDVVPVTPTRFRPASVMGDKVFENPKTVQLTAILNCCERLRELQASAKAKEEPEAAAAGPGTPNAAPKKPALASIVDAWIQLQSDVNALIDSTRAIPAAKNIEPVPGIRQALEKKEGLFRKHMMGKRVNYAARSVISPDPNIETSEIGVPPVFAVKLTYPEPVTYHNVKELRQAVINGPKVWPGATHVQHEDGEVTALEHLSKESRIALANQLLTPQDFKSGQEAGAGVAVRINKKVLRHLRDGDVVLMNRQPTLHKPSIMAHRVKVLPGEKTIRMHYANCNTYNADFDGDEMNMHLPQNEIARAEAMFIASNDEQYLVPTSGSPLRGLIQDHVVTGVHMTARDTFFTREQYHQVLYGALRPDEDGTGGGRVVTLPPAILKPRKLWTGKQVISTLLRNLTLGRPQLNLVSKAQVTGEYWGKQGVEEATVIFQDGELLTGVLDKSQFGAKAYGLVHSCYELYGSTAAGKLLSILGRLFTKYVQMIGFTCRMDDLRLTTDGDKWRNDLLHAGENYGRTTALEYVGLADADDDAVADAELQRRLEEVLRSDEKMAGMDAAMKTKMNGLTSAVINKCLPNGLLKKFPSNNMQMMTVSGAKGSRVNVSQISCMLGQQELEGRRVPTMVSGKTLPSFSAFESSARAGGYIAGRFLTGIRPQEYYFHCMAGREGLIDTAVKTSRSGYLQRCLIKHLEGITVHYDHTVRDVDGSVLQFRYGEDALDVTKQKHLYQFRFSADNFDALIEKYHPESALAVLDTEAAEQHSKKAARKPHKYDPVLAEFSPSRNFYCTSEKFHKAYEDYIEKNPDCLITGKSANPLKRKVNAPDLTKKKFRALMALRYLHSLAEPGEAVGLLAAQSIGEPSTQMTLNTFHFAGFGAKNVTLGIPRLREIVMTASAEIKTPSMTLTLKEGVSEKRAQSFCQDISRLTLAALVDEVVVREKLTAKALGRRYKRYTIRLNLFTKDEYKAEHDVKPSQIERAIETVFIKKLETAIQRDLRKVHRKSKAAAAKGEDDGMDIGKPAGRQKISAVEDDTADVSIARNDDESDDDDNDAGAAKRGAKRTQHASYDAPDEDDAELIAAQDREVNYLEDDEAEEGEDDEAASEAEEGRREADGADATEAADGGRPEPARRAREVRIIESHPHIVGYRFDASDGAWCEIDMQYPVDTRKILMVSIVEKVCRETVIREIPGVGRCFPIQNESESDKSRRLATDGCNLNGVWAYDDVIDVSKIYANDIAAILRTYGVEAARGAIMAEVSGVFGVYGIEVDPRHLSLIADYMTFDGKYKPFNRSGIESNVSAFLKMSFETTCHFLTQSALFGAVDTLESPSARLVLGKPVKGGSGSFDVYQPLY